MGKIARHDLKEQAVVLQITLNMIIDMVSESDYERVAELIGKLNEGVFRVLREIEKPKSASELRREFGL